MAINHDIKFGAKIASTYLEGSSTSGVSSAIDNAYAMVEFAYYGFSNCASSSIGSRTVYVRGRTSISVSIFTCLVTVLRVSTSGGITLSPLDVNIADLRKTSVSFKILGDLGSKYHYL